MFCAGSRVEVRHGSETALCNALCNGGRECALVGKSWERACGREYDGGSALVGENHSRHSTLHWCDVEKGGREEARKEEREEGRKGGRKG
jgi:hypothetical protein